MEDADLTADIAALPLEDASFDLIICSHVLEHVPDVAVALRELRRVIHPDGLVLLMYPVDQAREFTYEDVTITSPEGRQAAFAQDDHVRIFGRDHVSQVRKAGFEIIERRYHQEMGAKDRERYGIPESEGFAGPAAYRGPAMRLELCTILECRPSG